MISRLNEACLNFKLVQLPQSEAEQAEFQPLQTFRFLFLTLVYNTIERFSPSGIESYDLVNANEALHFLSHFKIVTYVSVFHSLHIEVDYESFSNRTVASDQFPVTIHQEDLKKQPEFKELIKPISSIKNFILLIRTYTAFLTFTQDNYRDLVDRIELSAQQCKN